MFALTSITTTPATLAVPPSALSAPVSDQESTRVTSVAVAAPLSDAKVTNDASNAQVTPVPAAQEQAIVQQALGISGGVEANLSTAGPSTPFLAQLISQSNDTDEEDNQIALAASFARFAPAPSYTTFIGYGIVKYRPSDAGLPSAYASSAAPSAEPENDNAPIVAASQAYGVTQSRNQSNLGNAEPQYIVAG